MKPFSIFAASLALAFGCATAPLYAASARPATPPAALSFFENNTLQDVEMSPSGRWLAVQSRSPDSRTLLMVMDLDNKEPSRIIAQSPRLDVSSFNWVGDDWLTFSLSDEYDRSGKAKGVGLNVVSRDGKKMRPLIARVFSQGFEFINKKALEPNNVMLAVGPGANEIVLGEHHYNLDWTEHTHTSLRIMNVVTSEVRSYFQGNEPPEKIQGWAFDSQGRPRFATANGNNVTRVYWADAAGKWRLIGTFNGFEVDFWPAYVDDKDQVFVYRNDAATGLAQLHKFDLATNSIDKQAVLATPGFDTRVSPIQERGSNRVHGLHTLKASRGTTWFTPAMAAIQARIDASLPGRVNILRCKDCADPKRVLVYSYSDTHAGEYLLYTPSPESLDMLGELRAGHKAEGMASVNLHRTKTRDGADLPVWITASTAGAGKPRPAVVLVHGGPWIRGGEWRWDPEAQFLASRGYVVIEPEFRGSLGFGVDHYRAGWRQWGQRMQDDVSDALAFAVKSGQVDPNRVCIAGGSYGGYSALMGAVRNDKQYQCAIAWVAVTDPAYLSTVHWSDFSDDTRRYSLPTLVGDAVKDADMLAANSPLRQASKIKIPVLLAYGGKDKRVPIVHGTDLRKAMTDAGNPPVWLQYGDEAHVWVQTATRVDFWTRVGSFLDKHLGAATPIVLP